VLAAALLAGGWSTKLIFRSGLFEGTGTLPATTANLPQSGDRIALHSAFPSNATGQYVMDILIMRERK